jgi:hypothetical protein
LTNTKPEAVLKQVVYCSGNCPKDMNQHHRSLSIRGIFTSMCTFSLVGGVNTTQLRDYIVALSGDDHFKTAIGNNSPTA